MKKLLVLATVIVAGIAANAASFKWSAGNIYGPDGTTKWAGDVSLYAVGIDTVLDKVTISSGVINKTFETTAVTVGDSYDFYFVIEDNGKTFTSAKVTDVIAQSTSTPTIGFGNQASATQNASNWASSGGGGEPVPEPTSGLLMLLGAAGLALKRKRA